MCVTEGESGDESRTTVMYVWVMLHVYTCNWNGGWWLAWGWRRRYMINPFPVVGQSGITRLTQQFSQNYFVGITSDTMCIDCRKRV